MPISEQMPRPVMISRNVNSTPIHSDARASTSGPLRPAMKFANLYGRFWKKLLIGASLAVRQAPYHGHKWLHETIIKLA